MKDCNKVVLVSPAHPLRGGMASFAERLTQEMLNENIEAYIHSFSLQYPNFLFPGETQYSSSPAPKDLNILSDINSINPFNWWKVGRRIRKERPDLVVVRYWLPFMGPCLGTILRRVKRNGHTKVIGIIDNAIPHEKRIGDKLFTRYFLKPLDGFVVMSDQVLKDLSQFNKDKPRELVFHPLYDNFGASVSKEQALKHLKLDPQYKYVLFFGVIREYKGLDLLLKAFKELADQKIKLIVAGEYYEKKDKYENLIQELGIEESIIMHNRFIPNEEVTHFFCASDLVAQPYKSATQSGVTQIAYHFEIPMLVTNVGGLPEIVPNEKVGYVVERDPKDIAEGIQKFFSLDKAEEFKTNLQTEKKRFSWKKMVETLCNMRKELS